VPQLRAALRRPEPYLALIAAAFCAAALDAAREPERQMSARAWVAVVRTYQAHARPLLEGRVRCRYHPTCSEYSIEAVRQRGIVGGSVLTARRIARCRGDVPLGTEDPVPAR
jgi:uncharacterized protein